MSIKESLIKNYKEAGGSDPKVMESTSALVDEMNGGSSSGGILVVNLDTTTDTLDHTWQEIYDSDVAIVISVITASEGVEKSIWSIDSMKTDTKVGEYHIMLRDGGLFITNNPNGYPTRDNS